MHEQALTCTAKGTASHDSRSRWGSGQHANCVQVFYWFSVPHDRLFLDALERDLKREKAGQEPTSVVVGEPARSFK